MRRHHRESQADRELRHAIIEFYRVELEARYSEENIRRFDVWSGVSDEEIAALRAYFMDRIYPPPEVRDVQDEAFERMGDVVRSPRRLRPIVPVVIRSVWEFGRQLPAALRACIRVLDAYAEIRKLEDMLMDNARRLDLSLEQVHEHERMIKLMAHIPEKDIHRLVYDMIALFNALSNTKMLTAAVHLMDGFMEVMRDKGDLYHPAEVEGMALAQDVVDEGLALFLEIPRPSIERILEGIETVELEWYKRIQVYA